MGEQLGAVTAVTARVTPPKGKSRRRDPRAHPPYLPVLVVNHDVVGFDVSVHDAHAVAVIQGLWGQGTRQGQRDGLGDTEGRPCSVTPVPNATGSPGDLRPHPSARPCAVPSNRGDTRKIPRGALIRVPPTSWSVTKHGTNPLRRGHRAQGAPVPWLFFPTALPPDGTVGTHTRALGGGLGPLQTPGDPPARPQRPLVTQTAAKPTSRRGRGDTGERNKTFSASQRR